MRDKEYLRKAAKRMADALPDNHGFILLTMPLGEGGRVAYCANIDRQDAINVLKEFLICTSGEEEWMKHIK